MKRLQERLTRAEGITASRLHRVERERRPTRFDALAELQHLGACPDRVCPRLQVLSLDERAAMAAVIWAELDRRGREHVTDGH